MHTTDKPWKAIAAFALATLGLIVQALAGKGNAAVTAREWFIIVVGSIVTAGTVYMVDNRRSHDVR